MPGVGTSATQRPGGVGSKPSMSNQQPGGMTSGLRPSSRGIPSSVTGSTGKREETKVLVPPVKNSVTSSSKITSNV